MKLSLVSMAMFILLVMLGVENSRQILRRLMDPRGPPKEPPREPPGGRPTKPANRTCNITKMSKLVADHFTFEKEGGLV